MKYSIPSKIIVFTLISLCIFTGASYSAPTGGSVSHGDANINHNGGNTTINQNSDKAIINWGSFDIAHGESVIFNQKNANSIILNRVTGGEQSFINGSLSANGKVFILNSSGILIGGGASINTGSFLASTGQMSDNDFMSGNYNIHSAFGDITNNGSITVDNYGYAALLGRRVINNGVISANLGRVEIASGEAFRVSFYDNNLIGVSIEKGVAESYISNTGTITAEGGTIYMSAKGLSDIIKSTVNNEGVIYAGSISNDGGRVVLSAGFGEVNNGNLIDVSSDIGQAGNVEIYGNDIIIQSEGAVIDASGESGGNVYLKASHNAEVKDKATITASGTSGNGGGISVLSKGVLFFDKGASLFSQSVTGNGGFIEVSSVDGLHLKGTANTLSTNGNHGMFILDPYNIVITNTASTKSSITDLFILDINTALATNGSFTLNAVNISMDPSAYGVAIGTGTGDLTFNASNNINFVSPNIHVDKLTMTAEYGITISKDPTKPAKIMANEFNITSFLANINSTGVELELGNLLISSPEGSTELDSLSSATGMNVSGVIGKDLKLSSTNALIDLIIDNDLTAVNSMSFNLPGANSSLTARNGKIITESLNLDVPTGIVSLRDANFVTLNAVADKIEITNSSVEEVTIENLSITSSFRYTHASISDVIIESLLILGAVATPDISITLQKGKLTFPFEIALSHLGFITIQEASTIIFKAQDTIDLSINGPTGITGTDFFTKFGSTNAGAAKLISFEAPNSVKVDITSRLVNSSLNMVSENSFVTGRCTSALFCTMASISASASGDILIDRFGTLSYSAKSGSGNIVINMGPIAGATAAGTPASSITFANLETTGDGRITLTALPGSLANNAPINILNLNAGSNGLVLSLINSPLINIISKTIDDLDIMFASGNDQFSSFSVVSEGSINFIDAFDFTPTKFLSITSNFGDISLNNTDVFTSTSISLSANNIVSSSGSLLNFKTGTGSSMIEESISLNVSGDNQVEFNIDALNRGILNLNGNMKVNINGTTTIGKTEISSTSMTGNIIIDDNGGGHAVTLKDIANVNSFIAESVGNVILDPTFKATATGEFSINSNGTITSAKSTDGDKAWIHADHISLIATRIGGGTVFPTPEDYTDTAIMVEANTGYFEATDLSQATEPIIDIGSADFMSSLFKYKFAPSPDVDTRAFLNGLNIKSNWHDELNTTRNDYYLYNPDLRYSRYLKYDIYDDVLALGDDLIISDIVYKKFIHSKFKVGNSIFLK